MFGMDFYKALGPLDSDFSTYIYGTYLAQAGFSPDIIAQKSRVFGMYADADASPKVMPNYGDNGITQSLSIHLCYAVLWYAILCYVILCNPLPYLTPISSDPHWSRAFTKLSQLVEHHPSAILFDSGRGDPTADSGTLEGKRDVTIPKETSVLDRAVRQGEEAVSAAVTLTEAGGGASGGGE